MFWTKKKPKEPCRKIFTYWDGEKVRKADPLVVSGKLNSHDKFKPDFDFQVLASVGKTDEQGNPLTTNELAEQSVDNIVSAVHEAFGVRQFSEDAPGLTQLECLTLINEFYAFMDRLKKSTSDSPTPPRSMGATSAKSSVTITPGTSDCC